MVRVRSQSSDPAADSKKGTDAAFLERGNPWWVTCALGLPLALGMLSHALFNLVDLLLVGQLGGDAVAAAHVATAVNFLPMVLGNGVSVAAISLMSRQLGQGQVEEARRVSSRSQGLMLGLGLLLGVVGALLASPCVDALATPPAARADAVHYLVITSLGTVTMFTLMQATASMRAAGEVAMPLITMVGANVANVLLDVVLLFGWEPLGIPALGVVGAAYATVIARLVFSVIAFAWLFRASHLLRIRGRHLLPDYLVRGFSDPHARWNRLLSLGLPQIVQMAVRALAVLTLTRIAGNLEGAAGTAALGVTTRLDTTILFASLGFASAATTTTGRACAQGLEARARKLALTSAIQAFLFGGLILIVLLAMSENLVRWFVPDASAALVAVAAGYIATAAWAHPLGSFCIAASGAVNGAGRMVAPMVLDLVGYGVVILPATLMVAAIEGVEAKTVWWTFASGHVLLAFAYLVYLLRSGWPRPTARGASDLSLPG